MKVALTVDDLPIWPHDPYPEGYSAESITDSLISAFDQAGASGVFAFSNSWPLIDDPGFAQIFDRWVQAGHHVANHTHRHPILNEVSAEAYKDEIALADRLLDPWLSKAPERFFRYTLNLWGDTEEKLHSVKNYLRRTGYAISEVTSWFYEWDYNYAYLTCLLASDKDGMEVIKKSFLEYSIAQLKHDNEEAKKWFGREILGIVLVHTVPLFADIAGEFLELLEGEGVEFIPLTEAAADPIYEQAASVVSSEFLVYQQKLAAARGSIIPRFAPGFETKHMKIQEMGQSVRPSRLGQVASGGK